jgi:hypothetical protein
MQTEIENEDCVLDRADIKAKYALHALYTLENIDPIALEIVKVLAPLSICEDAVANRAYDVASSMAKAKYNAYAELMRENMRNELADFERIRIRGRSSSS